MRTPRRYLAECEGEWKWAAAARAKTTKFKNAAIGWTTRSDERERLAWDGRLKSGFVLSGKRLSGTH